MVIGIILASGFSNRMGQDKLLLEVEGKRILEKVILAAKNSKLDDVVLVYRTNEVKELGDKYNIKTIYNKNAKMGQSQSVILGVQEVEGEAYMFFVGDQPYLTSDLIDKLILEHKSNKDKIVIPYYNDNICMPILFPSNYRENLLRVEGDKGGKEIIADNPDKIIRVDVKEEKLICDVDTIEDYEKLKLMLENDQGVFNMEGKKYILAVPNFSDGRRSEVIEGVTNVIKNREGVTLVSVEPEHDFNRTVVTILGEPEPLKEALIEMAGQSYKLINMSEQKGTHPRIGSQDTIPLFPFKNISIEEVKQLAEEIGQEIFDKYGVPVFFSGENARTEYKKSISNIRKGQYEGLKGLLEDKSNPDYETRKPDLSIDGKLSPTLGATIVSADMEGLTAYNVFLATEDVEIAKQIAKAVRGPSGGFSTTRAVGIKFPEREGVVVSINMFDCGQTPLYRAYELVKLEAQHFGIAVTGSEIVGPVKLEYLLNNLNHYLGLQGLRNEQILETHLIEMP